MAGGPLDFVAIFKHTYIYIYMYFTGKGRGEGEGNKRPPNQMTARVKSGNIC